MDVEALLLNDKAPALGACQTWPSQRTRTMYNAPSAFDRGVQQTRTAGWQ
jgi:hypothetical protein